MNNILSIIDSFQNIIIAALVAMVIILFFMVIIQLKAINKLENRYRKLMRGTDNKSIEELVTMHLDKIDKASEQTEYMMELYKSLNNRVDTCVQRVSIVRYRAFEDVGSDLSYSIALLDNKNNGVILTGIYGRNESTTYAKPIDKGLSRYELSDEEKYVLEDAMNKSI
ncbi:DUF4446 family protein [Clostridium lundense]|uniref:DUF4446 family protein n=1 Tax=Clostridium lundense TaxID=319475 RepID=UPI0004871C92|nr:DUF4446 family protein [Clostridium lundense]